MKPNVLGQPPKLNNYRNNENAEAHPSEPIIRREIISIGLSGEKSIRALTLYPVVHYATRTKDINAS